MIEGDLPPRARKLVIEWAGSDQQDLKDLWATQHVKKLPPLQ